VRLMRAAPAREPDNGSLSARVTGMVLRFVARQLRSKPLAMRNTLPMISFTFDDVPASACERGTAVLERHGARGTFYVSGSGCGRSNPAGPVCASVDQLRTIWANGHEIGCHTYSHPAVRRMSLDELGVELELNQSVLRKIDSDIVVRNFAYPYGDMSVRTKRYLEARFDSCRSGHPGINVGVADLGALNAWPLDNASIDRTRIVELIDETVHARGWLIFYSHDVAERPSRFGVAPDLLEWAVGTAKRRGCALTTIAEGLRGIGATTGDACGGFAESFDHAPPN
jgi:peptidoglycan/xylan/chitin deacetylase (PgdA/CDA1 family)